MTMSEPESVLPDSDSQLCPSDRVRKSALLIASTSRHVTIHSDSVKRLAELLATQALEGCMGLARWKQQELHPKTMDQAAIDWIFIADVLNFSFWSEPSNQAEKYAVNYKGKSFTGYWSCCAAMNRAIDEGIPILDASYLANLTDDQVHYIFRTSTVEQIPMIDHRRKNLQEAGRILLQKYNGTFANCVKQAEKSSQKLLEIIQADFPSFRDAGSYKNHTVEFYKRAQILVADVWACFEGKGEGTFWDIDLLTVFADYRIPQILNFFGSMTYSTELQQKLKNNHVFQYNEEDEQEIRGCSIHVCELLKTEINRIMAPIPAKDIKPINAIILDHFLWDYRLLHSVEMDATPYHKVRCIYY